MNLNQLRVFYVAAREGNQTRAAKALHVSQPAVTKALQRLQDDEGLQLFVREGTRLRVTEAGERLYAIAEEIFEREEAADALLSDLREQEQTALRIDSSLTFGDYYLPRLVHEYRKKMPDVHTSVSVTSTSDLIPRSLRLQNDIGFCSYEVPNPHLEFRPVVRERLLITTRPEHRFSKLKYLSPDDLNGETIISHEPGSVQKNIIDELISKHGLTINLRSADYTSNEAIKVAIHLHEGIALMSEKAVEREVRNGELYALPIGKRPITRKLFMVLNRDRVITPKIQTFIDVCNEHLGL
jgi:DNA-binding transcriptional LysR family regulator